MRKQNGRTFFRRIPAVLLAAALTVALPWGTLAEEEIVEGDFISEETNYLLLSEPDRTGGGLPVTLEVVTEEALPGEPVFRWYSCDEAGQKDELLAEGGENRYRTEAFEEPEIRRYLCEVTAGGETETSEVFTAGYTGLPLIVIQTEDGSSVEDKDRYLEAGMSLLTRSEDEAFSIRIKGRGNATLGYPKKPYTVKLEEKTKLLGMKKAKKWALLPGYCDKTLLRVSLGFETSRLLGLAYTPDYRYVDVVFNGEYAGNYVLTEVVREEAKYLDFTEDGYLVEQVKETEDGPEFFRTEQAGQAYEFKYPEDEELTDSVRTRAAEAMDRMEQAVSGAGKEGTDWQELIDTESWVNWLLVQNILANRDTNYYYYQAEAGAKIAMGPVWDFEWSLGIGWYDGERPNPEHKFFKQTDLLKKLLKNKPFLTALGERWEEIAPEITDRLIRMMDETAEEIRVSREMNFLRWDILNEQVGAGGIPLGSYEAELACDQAYLKEHIQWLDGQIREMCAE